MTEEMQHAVDVEKAWITLEQNYQTGEVMEVSVTEVVKGGLVVDVGVRGFVPASLVERHFVEDFSDYVGKTLRVKVIELDKENNKVILSQKAVLEEEVQSAMKSRLESLQVGDVLEGTVQRIASFGVFVEIGGIDGLVHVSELSWNRVESPEAVVQVGYKVKVKVIKVDADSGKVSLSIKALEEGPWDKAASALQEGKAYNGTVKRLVNFGAFVEVLPGVEGLVHISQIANRRIGSPSEVLKEGQEVQVKVLEIDTKAKKISLSIRELLEDEEAKYVEEYKPTESQGLGLTLGDLIGDKLKKLK